MHDRPPLHGYNTNYRRDGRLYHVQTEDMGRNSAAIVTQVFIGGTILATRRTSYRDLAGEGTLVAQIQRLMQQQHKDVLFGLRDGTIELAEIPAALDTPEEEGKRDARDTIQMQLPPEFLEELERELLIAGEMDEPRPADSRVVVGTVDARDSDIPLMDIDALTSSPPPPPPPVAVTPSAPAPACDGPQPDDALDAAPLPAKKTDSRPASRPPDSGRTIHGLGVADRQREKPRSDRVFSELSHPGAVHGEELLGERSLDEVILSYLAEDLQKDS